MIFIGLGGNLPSPRYGGPRATLEAALTALSARGVGVRRRSRWYRSAPVPASDQPWFINAVAEVTGTGSPEALLASLHAVEAEFGRVRSEPNAARIIDLDLLDYDGLLRSGETPPILPHPRLQARGFVLLPLAELEPHWRHPASGLAIAELIDALPANQFTEAMDE